ncbi:Rieske (2Fe-2S) protein [Streptomyces gamaensis]|uniref:Cytochrome bc1 complex Rieske iron-sulfur subunit n=1 Tax=Streptomyces gamaensis TaxID=1763542 RepID=A0ABW0ZAE3_9ACTN
MTNASSAPRGSNRRTVVAAAGAAGLAAVLAACGGSGGDQQPGGETTDGRREPGSGPTGRTTPGPAGSAGSGRPGGEGQALAPVSDIPEGGGKVFPDRQVVVTQPVRGEFRAFSAVCTHQQCVVRDVSGGTVNCPCHGSKYAVTDGSVRHGPATAPLPSRRVVVRDGTLHLA